METNTGPISHLFEAGMGHTLDLTLNGLMVEHEYQLNFLRTVTFQSLYKTKF